MLKNKGEATMECQKQFKQCQILLYIKIINAKNMAKFSHIRWTKLNIVIATFTASLN